MGMPPFSPHDNDPLRAVLAALEMRDTLKVPPTALIYIYIYIYIYLFSHTSTYNTTIQHRFLEVPHQKMIGVYVQNHTYVLMHVGG